MLEPLKTLRQIFQEAAYLHHPSELLELIALRVRESMQADVCSIYLFHSDMRELVLQATRGLQQEAVGTVRLPLGEGLVGYVARHQTLLNLANAARHPSYIFFPTTGEDRYPAFLGVPVINFRQLVGVLVVQRTEEEAFSDEYEAFLITIAAQLAATLQELLTTAVDARNLDSLVGDPSRLATPRYPNLHLHGVKGAAGLGIGTIVWASRAGSLDEIREVRSDDPEEEVRRFSVALAEANAAFKSGGDQLSVHLPRDVVSLYNVYRLILEDRELSAEVERRIHEGWTAESALKQTVESHARVFENMEDAYLQAKAEDIRHIGDRVYAYMQGDAAHQALPAKGAIVLVGRNLSIADVAAVPANRLRGLISTSGSTLSHLSVLANAMGIPAVVGVGEVKASRITGKEVIVDGYQALAIFNPVPNLRKEYRSLVREEQRLFSGLAELRNLPAVTPDGFRVHLLANTGLVADLSPGLANGAEGVGLYRSEIPFMIHESFPSEEEQVQLYRQILEAYAPRQVCMRTLDVGGDKPLPYYVYQEDNPFLGWRGVRFTLDNPTIFLTQIRAMLRASEGLDNLRILLPMVAHVEEVVAFKSLLDDAMEQLRDSCPDLRPPEIGAMIEVPSAAWVMDQLARHVQFVSLGSNDFTQYLLAVDRTNDRVASLYDWLSPPVLRAITEITRQARKYRLPCSICGEMAADPRAVLLLVGMGMETMSLSAYSLPKTKWVVRTVPKVVCDRLLRKALRMEDREAVRALLDEVLVQYGLGGLIRAGSN